jgi:hypothetical protein
MKNTIGIFASGSNDKIKIVLKVIGLEEASELNLFRMWLAGKFL